MEPCLELADKARAWQPDRVNGADRGQLTRLIDKLDTDSGALVVERPDPGGPIGGLLRLLRQLLLLSLI